MNVAAIEADINRPWRAAAFQLTCACRVVGNANGVTVYYPRLTRLGERIRIDAGGVRAVLANYLRQELGLRRGVNATMVMWVGG